MSMANAVTLPSPASAARWMSKATACGLSSRPTKSHIGKRAASGRSKLPEPQPQSTTVLRPAPQSKRSGKTMANSSTWALFRAPRSDPDFIACDEVCGSQLAGIRGESQPMSETAATRSDAGSRQWQPSSHGAAAGALSPSSLAAGCPPFSGARCPASFARCPASSAARCPAFPAVADSKKGGGSRLESVSSMAALHLRALFSFEECW
mmetsp:Transcript_19619/g.66317  ORF Transcript_19619/g.66317 Transcript_19619/m.66317 type:complete len:208 (+) Transcript_19619:639-1262(+)